MRTLLALFLLSAPLAAIDRSPSGYTIPAGDGCNWCRPFENGTRVCTMMLCADPNLRPKGSAIRSLATPSLAIDPRCPQPAGLFSSSVGSGTNVVCLVDVPAPTSYALWAVPAVGGGTPVRLSPEMAADRDVIAFAVSGDRVAYTSDPVRWTQYELFSVPISGGSPVKLSGSMPFDNDVDDFAFAGGRVVYRKGRNATGVWNLFSAPVTGGGSVQLSQSNMSAVQRGFQVRGSIVRFAQDPSGSGVSTWYAAPVVGGVVWTEIFPDGFESGTTGGWR